MKENEIEFRNSIDEELKKKFFDKKGNLTTNGALFFIALGIILAQQCLKLLGGIKKCK